MGISGAVALVVALLALPLVVMGARRWSRATTIAAARSEAFREDGWWAWPWPWQRSVNGVKFESVTLGLAALLMLVTAAFTAAGAVTF